MPLPTELESIAGAQELYDWFGYWPEFHDAEILTFHQDLSSASSLVIHTWAMTNRVDAQGYYEHAKNVVVEFSLQGISKVELVDFWDGSILLDLSIEKTESGFRLTLSSAYGLSGTVEAQNATMRITPGSTISR